MNQKLVCIVDDNDDIREIYRMKFASEGLETVTAADGAEGMKVIREKRPAVVLLDIQMPVMDGIAVLRELKADRELSEIPVIILSNVDSDDMFRTVTDLGAAEYYLIKSLVDPQRVIDVTMEALQKGDE
ncbi:MAG: response regulator [Candidatus Moranbacteria bacterium]|nr:response regulator [Candidatus Moranbacteria bacterium]